MFEIGTSLREARLRQGLDFPEVEQATKIRGKYLGALEDEQFDLLPAQTYVKGFLRSYAEYLGLDGQLYVDEYNSRFVVGEEEPPSRPRRSNAGSRSVRLQARVVLLTLLGIALLAALVIVAWTRGDQNGQNIPGLGSTISTPPRSGPCAGQADTSGLVQLCVTATRGSSWIQVHRGSAVGKILFQGTLDRGQSQIFTGPRLWITLDKPENLRTIVNHHTRRLPVGGVQTLIVTPNGFRPSV